MLEYRYDFIQFETRAVALKTSTVIISIFLDSFDVKQERVKLKIILK